MPDAVTRLIPSGVPGIPYGAFTGRPEAPAPPTDVTVDMILRVRGSRFATLAIVPDEPYEEALEWRTDILPGRDGTEQRIATRKRPRQAFRFSYALDGVDRQAVQNLLMDRLAQQVAVPAWSEQMILTAAAAPAATSVTVDSTANVDVRIGGSVIVFKDRRTFDVVVVQTVGATSITFSSGLFFAYVAGDLVVPAHLCLADPQVQGSRDPVNLERLQMLFRVIDNDTGAPAGSTAGWSAYGGKVLLDDPNVLDSQVPEAFAMAVDEVDGETGVVARTSSWDRGIRVHRKGFRTQSRATLFKLRQLLYSLRGRQVAFWIPTFREDVTATQPLGVAQSILTIDHVGYTLFARSRAPKNVLRITKTDGATLIRVVLSSVELSATEERLTVDVAWPANVPIGSISRVEFFEPVRFDTDQLVIEHSPVPGWARLVVPVRSVLDP